MTDVFLGAPWVRAIAAAFARGGGPLFVVGGAVRNPLLNLPLSDVDVCGPLLPEEVCALCRGTEVEARPRMAHFGTVELLAADASGKRHLAEYTTFREDSYRTGHKPAAVRFTAELGVDALRRDFSVNALYRPLFPDGVGDVIDPTGGLAHLRAGVLHTVTPDPDQVLKDDGLRILRAARFQAELGLTPTQALLCGMARRAALLGDIAPERIRDEVSKVLLADLRYPALRRAVPATASGLRTLWQTGAWPYAMATLAYDERKASATARLADAPDVSPLSLRAALLCDAPEAAEGALSRLRFSAKDANQARRIAEAMGEAQKAAPDPAALCKAGMDALEGALLVLDALESPAAARVRALLTQMEKEERPLTPRQLRVNGNDLKPLMEPCQIGRALDALWTAAVRGQAPNRRDALLKRVQELR